LEDVSKKHGEEEIHECFQRKEGEERSFRERGGRDQKGRREGILGKFFEGENRGKNNLEGPGRKSQRRGSERGKSCVGKERSRKLSSGGERRWRRKMSLSKNFKMDNVSNTASHLKEKMSLVP